MHTHRCMRYMNTVGTPMHTRQCTHTVIWLNMLPNIACCFWSDIFITLHPLLVFNAILLPQLLLSISRNRAHFLLNVCVWLCVCMSFSSRDETQFTYFLRGNTPVKHSCEQPLFFYSRRWLSLYFLQWQPWASSSALIHFIPLLSLYLHHTSEWKSFRKRE